MAVVIGAVIAASLTVAACYSPRGYAPSPESGRSAAPGTPAQQAMAASDWLDSTSCPAPDTGPPRPWRRTRSKLKSELLGAPHHSATDPVVNPGADATVQAKLAYGAISKDLSGEPVSLWLRAEPCGAWLDVAQGTTNGDGRVALTVPKKLIPSPGRYAYQVVVHGDLSRVHGAIYVLEPATEIVVFDIDGTLTTDDGELIEQMGTGREPEKQPGSEQVARRYAAAGYLPVYMSGRMYMLRSGSIEWLRRHKFPPGPVITTESFGDALPGNEYVGRFKTAALRDLVGNKGLVIKAAYGNADTDVCAYAQTGIPAASTFIVGPTAKRCGAHPPAQPLPSYVEHLKTLTEIRALKEPTP